MSPRRALLAILLAVVLASASAAPQPPPCSRSCAALNCDSVGIRYGKYCGVGWSGCDGEKPCDDLDACCRDHDSCVEKKGLHLLACSACVPVVCLVVLVSEMGGWIKPLACKSSLARNFSLDGFCVAGCNVITPLGMMSVKCHEKFKNCMRKVKKAGKVGFSKKCPYEIAMATMTQGMDMAIMLSQLGSQKVEL
ncbi:probable phospholipase A2 homolog 1 isoform X1 [Sorghum bicolor]|uniref:probable phospholipase A2 homolog 1 isoform X1 n=1 Tax=Sorghum bicolor TaxID=4558 RepID=UPI000B425DA9|nr:probable phospholipase A2 homolog 1 isoform X1 [Sorghum bicolor]|eukprot:XP_021315398.1 probable phospholipase A2 homolog 1 isoform X1 [Sorghum bicolor]